MGEKTLLPVNGNGGITLPDAARRALQLEPGSQVECEVVDSAIVLRKFEDIPAEDAWLYRPASVARLKDGAQRAASGRRWQVTERFLLELAAQADAAHAAGQELSPSTLAAALAGAERTGDAEQVGPDPARAPSQ